MARPTTRIFSTLPTRATRGSNSPSIADVGMLTPDGVTQVNLLMVK